MGPVHAGTYFPPTDAYGRPGKASAVPLSMHQGTLYSERAKTEAAMKEGCIAPLSRCQTDYSGM